MIYLIDLLKFIGILKLKIHYNIRNVSREFYEIIIASVLLEVILCLRSNIYKLKQIEPRSIIILSLLGPCGANI